MSDTYSYEVLEPGGHARLVGNVLDRISRASANPASAVGSAAAMLGDPETASWMERTTAADGAALIEAVQGNTLRWNQFVMPNPRSVTSKGVTYTNTSDGKVVLDGTATGAESFTSSLALSIVSGHKYVYKGADVARAVYGNIAGIGPNLNSESVYTATSDVASTTLSVAVGATYAGTYECYPQLFDLTQMFGAGNEPATVAEFEALFPEPYYPYDAGSLLPVRMEGVETVAADESWSSQLAIPVSTYFPDGMRSAGTVRDELRADAAVTRVGAVDLGTLTWSKNDKYWYNQSLVSVMKMNGYNEVSPLTSEKYVSITVSEAVNTEKTGIANYTSALGGIIVYTGDLTNAPSGLLYYALATPTTTPIDPPLPMSYRTGAGGTERVMVASGTTSAPPIFATRYPLDPADLAASIAPRESAVAEANHAVGDLLMLGWTLCKVTTAIARGEAITIGTNVTRTSVAAELAALS